LGKIWYIMWSSQKGIHGVKIGTGVKPSTITSCVTEEGKSIKGLSMLRPVAFNEEYSIVLKSNGSLMRSEHLCLLLGFRYHIPIIIISGGLDHDAH